jgi:replicative DNA helicase
MEKNQFSEDPDFWPTRPMTEMLGRTLDQMEQRGAHPLERMLTGFIGIDQQMAGLEPREITIIGGQHRTGKTTIALGISQHVASAEKQSVLYISTRDPVMALIEKLLGADSEVKEESLRRGTMRTSEWKRIGLAVQRLSEVNIQFLDHPFPRFEHHEIQGDSLELC